MLNTEQIKRMSQQTTQIKATVGINSRQDVKSLSWLLEVFISTTGIEKKGEGMDVPWI